ncbi:MAG: serine/threonine-protein kinase [Cyanobacteriota bacterium]|nr:serine/threonine-protein kinase [Cyanobacteriota bacterium]
MPMDSISTSDPFLDRLLVQRYRLTQMLGQGAMGRVYLAEDMQLGQVKVAVKLLTHTLGDEKMKLRFEREAKACAYLGQKSLHIVRVNDYGITSDQVPFYVMEYLRGLTLKEILEQGRLPLPRFFRLARQIGLGLKAAHEGIVLEGRTVQVIHRDLKPANVLVVADDSLGEMAKLLDFGIAKLIADSGSVSVTNAYLGTLAYSSPEQLEGLPLDPRSDIYSLGIMLYQMLSGSLPITPTTDSFPGWYQAHHKRRPKPLTPLVEELSIPAELGELIMACLAKDPASRPQTVQEVVQRLDTLSVSQPPSPLLVPVVTPPTLATHRLRPTPPPAPPPALWSRIIPLAIGGLLGLAAFRLALTLLPSPSQVGGDPATFTTPRSDGDPSGAAQIPVETDALTPALPDIPNLADSPELQGDPQAQLQTFPINTPQSAIRQQLGSPTDSGKGFWPNTVYDRYRLGDGDIDLGLIYDQNDLTLRQTEATISDSVSDGVAANLLEDMVQQPLPEILQAGLIAVRSRTQNRYDFASDSGLLEGVIERNPQGRVYMAIWERDLHTSSPPSPTQPVPQATPIPRQQPAQVAPANPRSGNNLRKLVEKARDSRK